MNTCDLTLPTGHTQMMLNTNHLPSAAPRKGQLIQRPSSLLCNMNNLTRQTFSHKNKRRFLQIFVLLTLLVTVVTYDSSGDTTVSVHQTAEFLDKSQKGSKGCVYRIANWLGTWMKPWEIR